MKASRLLRRAALLACLVSIGGCTGTSVSGTGSQTTMGQARLSDGLLFTITPGAIEQGAVGHILARSSTPVGTLSVQTTALNQGTFHLDIENVDPAVQVVVGSVNELDGTADPSCAGRQAQVITCSAAGNAQNSLCQPPAVTTDTSNPTLLHLTLDLRPCQSVQYSLHPVDATSTDPVRFVVLGATDGVAAVKRLAGELPTPTPDFAVLLGDNLPSTAVASDLDTLREAAQTLKIPVVVIPGEHEMPDTTGAAFEKRFGPLEFRWTLRGCQFLAIFSAGGGLGSGGFADLKRNLTTFNNQWPILAFTHVPPLDPNGLRDDGFRSRLEGTRTLSMLVTQGTDALFAGHLQQSYTEQVQHMPFDITSGLSNAHNTPEYLLVTLTAPTAANPANAGDHHMTIERRSL